MFLGATIRLVGSRSSCGRSNLEPNNQLSLRCVVHLQLSFSSYPVAAERSFPDPETTGPLNPGRSSAWTGRVDLKCPCRQIDACLWILACFLDGLVDVLGTGTSKTSIVHHKHGLVLAGYGRGHLCADACPGIYPGYLVYCVPFRPTPELMI